MRLVLAVQAKSTNNAMGNRAYLAKPAAIFARYALDALEQDQPKMERSSLDFCLFPKLISDWIAPVPAKMFP